MKAQCPACKKTFDIENEHLGTIAACPFCNITMQIPVPTAKLIDPYQFEPGAVPTITKGVFRGMLMYSLMIAAVAFLFGIIGGIIGLINANQRTKEIDRIIQQTQREIQTNKRADYGN